MNNEQLSQIKDLIKNNKRDRFVIFDNHEPALVVMSIDEYKKINTAAKKENSPLDSDTVLLDNINRAIAEWKSNQQDDQINEYGEQMEEEKAKDRMDEFYNGEENLSYYYDMGDEDD